MKRTLLIDEACEPCDSHGMKLSDLENEFTSAEAAVITGVDGALQRKWRQLKYVNVGEGAGKWTRWKPLHLAYLMALGKLAKLVGPSEAFRFISSAEDNWIAYRIYFAAVAHLSGNRIELNRADGTNQPLPRFAITYEDRPFMGVIDLAEILTGMSHAVIILDLVQLGQDLADRAPRPLVRLEELKSNAK